jgi:hypothetical protein
MCICAWVRLLVEAGLAASTIAVCSQSREISCTQFLSILDPPSTMRLYSWRCPDVLPFCTCIPESASFGHDRDGRIWAGGEVTEMSVEHVFVTAVSKQVTLPNDRFVGDRFGHKGVQQQ